MASTAAAFLEVSGGAVAHVDPEDTLGWVGALQGLDDANDRAESVQAGISRAEAFTWQRTVELTLQGYRPLTG